MAMTHEIDRPSKGVTSMQRHKMAASTTIFAGALVITNADGLLTPLVPGEDVQFAGVAMENQVSGATGTTYCQVARNGRHLLPVTDLALENVGDELFGLEDDVLLLEGDLDDDSESFCPKVGVIADFETASKVWVDISSGVSAPVVSEEIEPEE